MNLKIKYFQQLRDVGVPCHNQAIHRNINRRARTAQKTRRVLHPGPLKVFHGHPPRTFPAGTAHNKDYSDGDQ